MKPIRICIATAGFAFGLLLVDRPVSAGETYEDKVERLNKEAMVLRSKGKTRGALKSQGKAYVLARKHLGINHPGYLVTIGNLAVLYTDLKHYELAEPYAVEQLEGLRRYLKTKGAPDNHNVVLNARQTLAEVYRRWRRTAKCERLLLQNITILCARNTKSKDDWSLLADNRNTLGLSYFDRRKYGLAEQQLRLALCIARDATKVKCSPVQIGLFCNNLGHLYVELKKYDKAEKLLLEGWNNQVKKMRGRDLSGLENTLQNLAILYKRTKQLHKSAGFCELLLRHRKTYRSVLSVAQATVWLAGTYDRLGNDKKAQQLYHRGFKLFAEHSVPEDPKYIRAAMDWARYLAFQGKVKDALKLLDNARRGTTEYIGQLIGHQTIHRMGFSLDTSYRGDLYGPLTLAWQNRDDPGTCAMAASWLVNGKALFMEAFRENIILSRDIEDESIDATRKALIALRLRRAEWTMHPPLTFSVKSWKAAITQVRRIEQVLAERLRNTGAIPLRPRSWVDLAEVRRGLPKDGVLIDIARIKVHDYKARPGPKSWKPARYVALVTPPRGEVRMVDLGPAEPIDNAVEEFRKTMAQAPDAITIDGEAEAEAKIRTPLNKLTRLVLKKLMPAIGKAKHWLISPDAALWLVPWSALPLADGSYAVERHQISYLTTARDLAAHRNRRARGPSLVVGNPDFDAGMAVTKSPKGKKLPVTRGPKSRAWSKLRQRWDSLGIAGKEAAKTAAKHLHKYLGAKPKIYTGAQAVEKVLLKTRQPRVLVLVTHAYFLKGAPSRHRSISALQRIGMVFAGANKRINPPGQPGAAGLLTGMDIINSMDLRGTELVVLSACETGVGEIAEVDGVTALRQCFHLAGAESVIATLWKIPNQKSTELMKVFWGKLANTGNRAVALRDAQLQIIRRHRTKAKKKAKGPAHPYYWAGYMLTGAWKR